MNSLLAALGLVFVAELGDKSQLVALGFGARHRVAPVLLGVVAGYMVTNLLSVVAGGLLGMSLPTRAIGLAGGALFLCFAAWLVRSRHDAFVDAGTSGAHGTGDGGGADGGGGDGGDGGDGDGGDGDGGDSDGGDGDGGDGGGGGVIVEGRALAAGSGTTSLVMSVTAAMVVAELGDKTMVATATLAAQGRPALVWLGAMAGIVLGGTVGVLLGRVCGARLPERATRVGSAVLFAVSGVALLAANA